MTALPKEVVTLSLYSGQQSLCNPSLGTPPPHTPGRGGTQGPRTQGERERKEEEEEQGAQGKN